MVWLPRGAHTVHAKGASGCRFDPATASAIFLTTATDVTSMGLFLGLATLIVL